MSTQTPQGSGIYFISAREPNAVASRDIVPVGQQTNTAGGTADVILGSATTRKEGVVVSFDFWISKPKSDLLCTALASHAIPNQSPNQKKPSETSEVNR